MEITKNASILTALLLVTMAGAAGVTADGSDPLDPMMVVQTGTAMD